MEPGAYYIPTLSQWGELSTSRPTRPPPRRATRPPTPRAVSLCSPILSLRPTDSTMSGAAASAGASRFQSFMNHPAGAFSPQSHDLQLTKLVTLCIWDSDSLFSGDDLEPIVALCLCCHRHRPEDGVLLGPAHEVVFGGGRPQGPLAPRGQAQRVPERWCVSQSISLCMAHGMTLWLRSCNSPLPCAPPALTATGFIWVRYSLVITPINYSLAAVRPSARDSVTEG